VSATSTPDGTVLLEWDEVPTALGYEIFNLAHGANPVAIVPSFETSFEDFLVQQCEVQTYYLRAFGSGSCVSGPSSLVSARPVLVASKHESADFDGDGITDPSVFNPDNGNWTWRPSSGGPDGQADWGESGDLPVAADYDGDGMTDVAIFRPSAGEWWLRLSCGLATSVHFFGVAEDIPVPADFDGDGKADVAIFRPSTGYWWGIHSSDGATFAGPLGRATDLPVPGDYDGDGKADLAVYRSAFLDWQVLYSSDLTEHFFEVSPSDDPNDLPAPADYDGDDKTDPALLSPSTPDPDSAPVWRIRQSSDGLLVEHTRNLLMGRPAPGNYNSSKAGAEIAVVVEEDLTANQWIEESSKGLGHGSYYFGGPGTWPIPGLLLATVP